jgi:hypothetical protein
MINYGVHCELHCEYCSTRASPTLAIQSPFFIVVLECSSSQTFFQYESFLVRMKELNTYSWSVSFSRYASTETHTHTHLNDVVKVLY